MRRLLTLLAVVAAGIAVWWLAGRYLSVDAMVEREQQLRSLLDRRPVTAFAVGFVIYTLVSLFPGTSGKSVLCGWLYGFWQSLVMVTLSLTIAGVAGFGISRYLLRDSVQRWLGDRIDRLDRRLQREGTFTMLTLRMLHVPFTLVNYAAGATRLPTSTFAWTTFVGLIPSTMIFVGLGAQLPTLRQLQENGAEELLSWPLLVALVLMGALPWALRSLVRRLRPGLSDPLGEGGRGS